MKEHEEPERPAFRYYYKSPEDLRPSVTTPQRFAFFKNRGRLILLIDIVVLLLVFAILQYKDLLVRRDASSQETLRWGALELSGSFPGGSEGSPLRLYLNLRNVGAAPVRFPAPGEGELVEWRVEFGGKQRTQTTCRPPLPGTVEVRSGRIIDLTLECPAVAAGQLDIALYLRRPQGTQTLRFPTVWIVPAAARSE